MPSPSLEHTMPRLSPEHFRDVALRLFREIGAPWSDTAPPETTEERRITIGDDPNASVTRRASVDGARSIVLEETSWSEMDSNGRSSATSRTGTITGIAAGATVQLKGQGALEVWRVTGNDRDAVASVEAAWRAHLDRIVRERLHWYEHPAIPNDWMALARSVEPLRDLRSGYVQGLGHVYPTLQFDRGNVTWLLSGVLTLDPRGSQLRVLGPVPRGPWRACTLSGARRRRAAWVSPEPTDIARCLLGDVAWTLVEDHTRDVHPGDGCGFLAVEFARSRGRSKSRGDPVGVERARIWRYGPWVMRHAVMTSSAFASSFALAIQNVGASESALFANGRASGKPIGQYTTSSTPEYVIRVIASARVSIDPVLEAAAQCIRDAGWNVNTQWEPNDPHEDLPMVKHHRWVLDRLVAGMTTIQTAEFKSLSAQFVAAIREGGMFRYNEGNWFDECRLVDGTIVWTSGIYCEAPLTHEIATDEGLIATVLTAGYAFRPASDALSLLEALRDAIRSTDVSAKPKPPG